MAAIDGLLECAPSANNVLLLGQQYSQIQRRPGRPLSVSTVDGHLVGGPSADDLLAMLEQRSQLERRFRAVDGLLEGGLGTCKIFCSVSSNPKFIHAADADSACPLSMAR